MSLLLLTLKWLIYFQALNQRKALADQRPILHIQTMPFSFTMHTSSYLPCYSMGFRSPTFTCREMINEDKAACLLYLRIPHRNPKIGYLLCSVVRLILQKKNGDM